ncbi:MAG: cytochrome c3 family protein [Ignavibacteriota bacterium]|nr:hypothetical protein [Ignavibacteriota bacterium]
MKKILYILIPVIIICFLVITVSSSQTQLHKQENKVTVSKNQNSKISDKLTAYDVKGFTCKSCHVNEYPTKNDPGLSDCPREYMVSEYRSPKEGPDVVVINDMSDNYSGVVFSHKLHSQMSEMSGGCTGCHHYNTTGPVLNCRNCHDKNRSREDITVPDLKAAYHRQCMTCHKQWTLENGCNTQCHLQKGTNIEQVLESYKGKEHPKVNSPEKMLWETNSDKGKMVTFFHDEHNKLFRISCNTCHNQENCIKCHEKKPREDYSKPVKIQKSLEEHHSRCNNCHSGNSCTKCHSGQELSPFNHGKSTGWTLNSYHNKLECSKCHGNSVPIKKLDRNCNSCHKNFTKGKFDHKVTGIYLSEVHMELECKDCHTNGDFSKAPNCKSCHDDKSYPAQLPGTRGKK